MQYPAVTRDAARAYASARRAGRLGPTDKPTVLFRGDGAHGRALPLIEDALERIVDTFEIERAGLGAKEKDAFEGRLVALLHPALRQLPASVLSDRDFWRYLATFWLFDFGVWRDGKQGAKGDTFPSDDTFGCSTSSLHPDTISLRMFNRGEVSVGCAEVGGGEPYAVAAIAGSDVWKSHILRTLNWQSPEVTRQILLKVGEGELKTAVVRDFIKRIRRTRANVQLDVLTATQAAELVEEERAATVAMQAAQATDG